jgi:predicted transcriptional regulator
MQEHDEQMAEQQSLTELTAAIASAYVSHNPISVSDVGRLISDVGRQLHQLGEAPPAPPERPEPAVPVRRSIGKDHLVCLACGKPQRMLKRHLAVEHGLTPESYRAMFDLKPDYPMVAPSYAALRRELAIEIGLGRPKEQARKTSSGRRPGRAPKTDG